jgi:hypothetical protein
MPKLNPSLTTVLVLLSLGSGCGESAKQRELDKEIEQRSAAHRAESMRPMLEEAQLANTMAAAKEALDENDRAKLERAVAELETLGDKAIQWLVKDVQSADTQQRLKALAIIKELGKKAKAAAPALQAAANDDAHPEVQKAAADARATVQPSP